MDVNTANRLFEYRKAHNLSQDELAEKIGVSRQAVSKWERAEASPDTDNLILLAKLYNVSLDELVNSNPKVKKQEKANKGDYVNISPKGIHVVEEDGNEVHVGWKGIHVKDVDEDNEIHVDWKGVHITNEDGEQHYDHNDWSEFKKKSIARDFPVGLLVTVAYLIIGGVYNLWHPGWLVFFIIPIYHQFVDCFRKKSWRARLNSIPVVVSSVAAYLYLGFILDLWHPSWILLLVGPVYHSLVNALVPKKKKDDNIIDVEIKDKED